MKVVWNGTILRKLPNRFRTPSPSGKGVGSPRERLPMNLPPTALFAARMLYLRAFLAYGTERGTVRRAFKVMLVVGTLLTLINHGQDLVSGMFSWHWLVPMVLTYLVPFCVATYGEVQGKMQCEEMPMTAPSPDKGSYSDKGESGSRA